MDGTKEDMGNVGLAFGLNIMAGACTGIGAIIVAIKADIKPEVTGSVLALSAGVMVFVSFVDIYMSKSVDAFQSFFEQQKLDRPEDRAYQISMASFFAGILITMGLDFIVHKIHQYMHKPQSQDARDMSELAVAGSPKPNLESDNAMCDAKLNHCSTGTECKHENGKDDMYESVSNQNEESRAHLMKSGILTAIALALHNFPEGLATFMATLADEKLGIALAVAIAIHNIPEGMAVSLPTFRATKSRWKAIVLGTLSGLTEPLGGLVGYLVIVNTGMSELTYAILFGLVAGMMIYVSIEELLPLALRYDAQNKFATKAFYLGMLVMAASLVLFTL